MFTIKSIQKYNKYIIFFYFSLIFFICWPLIDDYGFTLDDYIYYTNGENTYLYIKSIFQFFFNNEINPSEFRTNLNVLPTIYELFLVLICKVFNISDFSNIYLTAHKINFLLFFSSLIVFFIFCKKIFNNLLISILGVTFIILSPRIFAESFYNSRDIFFMCLFIFYLNSMYNFLDSRSFKNTFLFSFFTALLLNSKILGIIPVFIFLVLYLYNYLNTKKKFFKEKNNIFLFSSLSFLLIYIFWPYLWNDPINNLFFALKNVVQIQENIILINFYFGRYLPSDVVPWHYRLIWFLITTPVVILFLFFGGLLLFLKKLIITVGPTLGNKIDFSKKEFVNIFLFFVFVLSFFILTEFNKSKYGGWRHLYFLYPIVTYFSLFFVNYLINTSSKIYINIIFIFIFVNFAYSLNWSVKNHPHQYVFFNFLIKNYAVKNFDLDWWGISHKNSLEYILRNSEKNKIKIFAEGFTSLNDTYLSLEMEKKNRIILSNLEEADYVIDSKMKRIRVNNNIKDNYNFKLIYELNIDDQAVNSIYIRKQKN